MLCGEDHSQLFEMLRLVCWIRSPVPGGGILSLQLLYHPVISIQKRIDGDVPLLRVKLGWCPEEASKSQVVLPHRSGDGFPERV